MPADAHDVAPDWAGILARSLVARASRAAERRRAREQQCRAAVPRLVDRLLSEPGIGRVWLFGSLGGEGGLVHEESDIDLAVEGLDAGQVDALLPELERIAGLPVDLVRYESASPALRARIEDGDLLHEP
jgi:predicted nucleotidyltransferase